MRRPARVLLATLGVGLVLFALVALVRGTGLAYTLGVPSNGVVTTLRPDKEVCQGPIDAGDHGGFDRVVAALGTFGRPGPELLVRVTDEHRNFLAQGRAQGYADLAQSPTTTIPLDHEVKASKFVVCFVDLGRHRVAFYGAGDAAAPSVSTNNGRATGGDLNLRFERDRKAWVAVLPS